MDFLPQDYEAPKSSSNYLKLQEGENKIRILSSPILGWEDWKNNKPIRFRMNQKPEKAIDEKKPIRHFWAMIVWNYAAAKVQIFEVTQATIRNRLEDLSKDKDWGTPYHYDIKIVKSGNDVHTKYAVNPMPVREIEFAIKEAFFLLPIDLEELYRGGDPFKTATPEYRTKAFWELAKEKEPEIKEEMVGPREAADIKAQIAKFISPSDPFWESRAKEVLKVTAWENLPRSRYDLVLKRIAEKKLALEVEEVPF